MIPRTMLGWAIVTMLATMVPLVGALAMMLAAAADVVTLHAAFWWVAGLTVAGLALFFTALYLESRH